MMAVAATVTAAAVTAAAEKEEEEKLPEGNYDNQPCRNCNLQLVIRSIFSLPSIHHGTNTRGSMRRRWRRGGGDDGDREMRRRRLPCLMVNPDHSSL